MVQQRLTPPNFPNTDALLRAELAKRPQGAVDILFVNPPAPDRGIWIRSQHRVGRRSREGMIWPQVDLAQMAALFPDLRVDIVDAIPQRMTWPEFERLLDEKRPRYYVTQVTAPTLQNDLYGAFLAKARGALTIAFGTHVTPMPQSTLEAYPALDFVLLGEPELTLRELVDVCEWANRGGAESAEDTGESEEPESASGLAAATRGIEGAASASPEAWWPNVEPAFAARLHRLFTTTDPTWTPPWRNLDTAPSAPAPSATSAPTFSPSHVDTFPHSPAPPVPPSPVPTLSRSHVITLSRSPVPTLSRYHVITFSRIRGLVWRHGAEIVINPPRPYIANLDDLPLPRHDLLPLKSYRAPLVGGPYAFTVPSRGCPAGCRFCIKHVSYGASVRFRSPENVLAELEQLVALGVRKIHMYTDLFTVNREHVLGICEGIIARQLPIKWTCNSRVDFVDLELLQSMRRAGCWMISWGIESGEPEMLKRMHKGITLEKVEQALRWSREAGIMNWGYFIIGLPGETEASIRKTIDFSKRLPLDLVLFHIAAPHPGTPFFFEVVENGWFRPGTRWEEVDMDRSTVLDYPNLKAEDLERWARRAFREWAFRPGPMLTYLRLLLGDPGMLKFAVQIGLETLGWK